VLYTKLSRALSSLLCLAIRAVRRRPHGPAALVDCVACRLDFVCPVAWEETDDTHWWIRLRCGACGASREIVIADEEAAVLERALDEQVASIRDALARFDHARMAAELERLSTPRRKGIDPSSFAT
jgi:hypothetical protein